MWTSMCLARDVLKTVVDITGIRWSKEKACCGSDKNWISVIKVLVEEQKNGCWVIVKNINEINITNRVGSTINVRNQHRFSRRNASSKKPFKVADQVKRSGEGIPQATKKSKPWEKTKTILSDMVSNAQAQKVFDSKGDGFQGGQICRIF